MRMIRLLVLTLIALGPIAPAAAQDGDIVLRGDAARQEIERILNADNLDTDRLPPREVAEAMAIIARGHAPEDFWNAYQAHVLAWRHYADAVEQAPGAQSESTFADDRSGADAERAIQLTFAEVERIARRYGARLPAPRVDLLRIA